VRGLCHRPLDLLYELRLQATPAIRPTTIAGDGRWLSIPREPLDGDGRRAAGVLCRCASGGSYIGDGRRTTGAAAVGHPQHQRRHDGAAGFPISTMLVAAACISLLCRPAKCRSSVSTRPRANTPLRRRQAIPHHRHSSGRHGRLAGVQAPATGGRAGGRPRLRRRLVSAQTMGLAAAGGKLYASLYYQNQVVIADPEKASPSVTFTWSGPPVLRRTSWVRCMPSAAIA